VTGELKKGRRESQAVFIFGKKQKALNMKSQEKVNMFTVQ
jgi:hypothetical protein